MVQNNPVKTRGRPKAYDRGVALRSLRDLFWENGFSGTSLDDMSAATSMNRPSLYNAFGDKAEAFRSVLDDYIAEVRGIYIEAFTADVPLREGLMRVYEATLHIYNRDDGIGRGCFMSGAALTDSIRDRAIAARILEALHEMDKAFRWRLRVAQERGELSPNADTQALAMVASTTHNALSMRIRAGESLDDIRKLIRQTVGVICG